MSAQEKFYLAFWRQICHFKKCPEREGMAPSPGSPTRPITPRRHGMLRLTNSELGTIRQASIILEFPNLLPQSVGCQPTDILICITIERLSRSSLSRVRSVCRDAPDSA